MTISSTVRKAGPFAGHGTTSEFPFEFKVFSAEDLYVVQYNEATNLETVLALDANYTVTLNADQNEDPGGTVELTSNLPTGYTLTITSDIGNLQPTDLTNRGGFYPSVINDALDRSCIQIQQLAEDVSRSVKVALSSEINVDLPHPTANELIGWDATATNLVNINPSTIATVVAYATAYADTFEADGVTTDWVLTRNPAVLYNLDVSIAGVTQVPVTDYTLSGKTFSTTSPAPAGAIILVKYKEGLPNYEGDAQDVRYVPSGTGAVETNVAAKLSETVSVKDFGAVGDGVTDDTAAIQAALATGKALYFPQPDFFYNVTTNLSIDVPFEAGLYRVFGGSGVITLGANSVAEVHPHWWGAEATQVSTIDATVAAKNTAAFNAAFSQSKYVVLPSGNYQIDGTIVIRNSCHGNGNRTVFYPTGNITATSIRGIVNAEIGLFSVNYALVGASSSNICVHIALGSTSLNDQTVACRLHHIYGFNCHRVVQYLPGDLGVSWNMTLEYIQGSNCSNYVIYFESDSVSTTLITVKNSGSISSPTGRGIYAINMTEVHIYDCYIDNGASSAGSLLYCFAANVDVDGFHVEGHTSTINDSIGAPIWLRASTGGVTVKNMYFADWTFTPGSAVPVFYMLLAGKSEVGSVSELSITVNNSATKYLANASTATSLNVTQYSPSSFYLAPITASYGVEPAAANISVGTSATTLLTTPLGGFAQVSQQCGLFLVNGVWTTDGTYAFTDLILITATGANARTVVTVSSNSIGGAHARTYSISGANIQLAMATATYRVSIKGLMMPRSRA